MSFRLGKLLVADEYIYIYIYITFTFTYTGDLWETDIQESCTPVPRQGC